MGGGGVAGGGVADDGVADDSGVAGGGVFGSEGRVAITSAISGSGPLPPVEEKEETAADAARPEVVVGGSGPEATAADPKPPQPSQLSTARWQVQLGGSFKDFKDAEVHHTIETAWASDAPDAEVEVYGATYLILFSKMRQVLKDDQSRWRSVRRQPRHAS